MVLKELNLSGGFTALVTPFHKNGNVDYVGLQRILKFQSNSTISGVLLVGTTGESPTLTPKEHISVIQIGSDFFRKKWVIGGTGSNSTTEAIEYTEAVKNYIDAALLVDPYYNKPDPQQLVEFYYGPIAETFPALPIIPYVIPGRTGGKGLDPENLAELRKKYKNIVAVKDATNTEGDERTILTRKLLPEPFVIFSGDDSMTLSRMSNPEIRANGVISVVSNVFPNSVQKLTKLSNKLGWDDVAELLNHVLEPLFGLVTVKTKTNSWPNPCGIKTLMAGLGMIDISMRPPLGPMDKIAVEQVRNVIPEMMERFDSYPSNIIREAIQKDIKLIEKTFYVDVQERISNDSIWEKLSLQYH